MSSIKLKVQFWGRTLKKNLIGNMASFITNIFKLMETTIRLYKLSIWCNINENLNFGRKSYGKHC